MMDLSEIEEVKTYRFCDTDTGDLYYAQIAGGVHLGLWKRIPGMVTGEPHPGDLSTTESVPTTSPEWLRVHSVLARKGIIHKENGNGESKK